MSVFIKSASDYSSYDTHHGALSVCGCDREAQGQMPIMNSLVRESGQTGASGGINAWSHTERLLDLEPFIVRWRFRAQSLLKFCGGKKR